MDAAVRKTIGGIVAFVWIAISAPATAQDYTTKPVTILVPQTPGASSDLLARTLAERLQALWGQSVVIDNRPGAGGNYAAMPDVPTIGETIPGFEMSSWLDVFAPAATSAPLVARIGDVATRIFNDPPVKEKLATLGLVVGSVTRGELVAIIKRDTEVRAALIKAANIQSQ